jgi:hypothetical protein
MKRRGAGESDARSYSFFWRVRSGDELTTVCEDSLIEYGLLLPSDVTWVQ